MPCFKKGTMITTAQGDVAIEMLKPGQLVLTRDNGYQPVRWIGARYMSGRFLLDNPHIRPVMVLADAFGPGLPAKDTMMSPNTRIPVASEGRRFSLTDREEPVAIKNLVNHKSVQQVDTTGIEYLHVMFARHEVISANGIWIESFKSGDYSLETKGNSQRNEIFEIFPNLRASQSRKKAKVVERRVIRESFRHQK